MRGSTILTTVLTAAVLMQCGPVNAADTVPQAVRTAVGYPGRPPDDRARDAARKPADMITFAGIKAGDIVADFVPGTGYYTRIFSHLVGPKGHVYPFVPLVAGAADPQNQKDTRGAPNPEDIMPVQNLTIYSHNTTVLWESVMSYGGQFGLPAQADVVWTSDNYHDLHNKAFNISNVAAVNKAIFRALKPGGVYVVIDYAAAKGSGFTQTETLHRSDIDAVKAEVLQAGFTLDGESGVLANAADDHTKPIFDASLNRQADQFALRFKKPLTATGNKRPTTDPLKNYYGNTYVYDLGAKLERHHFYYPDGTYQEFGDNSSTNLQEGTDFWDTDGHNCQIHEYPVKQRQIVVCHALMPLEIGQKAMQDNGNGPRPVTLLQGYHSLPK